MNNVSITLTPKGQTVTLLTSIEILHHQLLTGLALYRLPKRLSPLFPLNLTPLDPARNIRREGIASHNFRFVLRHFDSGVPWPHVICIAWRHWISPSGRRLRDGGMACRSRCASQFSGGFVGAAVVEVEEVMVVRAVRCGMSRLRKGCRESRSFSWLFRRVCPRMEEE